MPVTLRDVAQAAQVSLSTASRALSGSPRISTATRDAVADAAKALGYRPNRAASALRSRRSNLVGLVLNNLVNQSFHAIAEVVQRKLSASGYQLILSTTEGDAGAERSLLLTLADHGVDGCIIIGSGQSAATTNELMTKGIAVVNVIRSSRDSMAPTVLAGDREGAQDATEHLAALGHRRIGFIGGPETTDSGRERHAGYSEALQRRGIAYDDHLVIRGPFTQEFGAQATEELLDRRRATAMTALFAANHESVFGMLPVLSSRGVSIPRDLSLICFEDMPLLQMWHPPVTVVDNGARQIAELSVDLLLNQMQSLAADGSSVDRLRRLTRTYRVGSQLIARASSAAPPSGRTSAT